MTWRLLSESQYGYTVRVVEALNEELRAVQEDVGQHGDAPTAGDAADRLMGFGLVAIQLYLSEVGLIVREERATNVSVVNKSMKQLLHEFGAPVADANLRDMACVWHLANYWKHNDEWDADWTVQAHHPASARTIAALRQLGLDERTDHPFLAGVRRILATDVAAHSADYSLIPLLKRAVAWRKDALAGCRCIGAAPVSRW
jgi:hypothetical protein